MGADIQTKVARMADAFRVVENHDTTVERLVCAPKDTAFIREVVEAAMRAVRNHLWSAVIEYSDEQKPGTIALGWSWDSEHPSVSNFVGSVTVIIADLL